MRIKISGIIILVAAMFWLKLSFAQTNTATTDVNKDGKADVTYYQEGKNITKIEADTNYDSKPDVTINTENGKFKSAEADTDYNGTIDKKFSNAKDFNAWLNKDKPEFVNTLGFSDDGTYTAVRF